MADNPLLKLQKYGQSIWLDFLRRGLITSGELQRLIEEDGIRGVTSNPAIFEKAIAQTDDYEGAIAELAQQGKRAQEIYETLTVEDIQSATDLLRSLYDDSDGRNGFVSLEVDPHLARDAAGTIDEARLLWEKVDRPNLLIKVPATVEGLPAIQQLISEGINVNVTLLFGLPRYRGVADAYISGLEERVERGEPVDRIASVASFFLSRIDVLVDPMLEAKMEGEGREAEIAGRLRGQVAIASAKVAYQIYKDIFDDARFQRLRDHGARVQRLLWASTSTKNPEYSDVKYVEPLIGPKTVNTLPMRTIDAYRDHGDPEDRLEEGVDEAREVLELLPEVGIDIDEVTAQLVDEGIEKFNNPFDELMATLEAAVREHAAS
ncbi:MAG: transaldolase [Armatimonadota bacterium]|nr:transaldolase [Armatimonadota bacterium]